jgi:hypothetical protein
MWWRGLSNRKTSPQTSSVLTAGDPCLQAWGGRWLLSSRCIVLVTINSVKQCEEPVVQSLDRAAFCLDVERPACPDRDTPHKGSCFLAGSDYSADHVANLETEVSLLAMTMPARESIPVRANHLPITMTGGFDHERSDTTNEEVLRRARSDTSGI